MGEGKDGLVLAADNGNAVKVHVYAESYQYERDAYIRFRDLGVEEAAGFQIPVLIDFDDDLFVIEMSIVSPPFVVDFASVRLDEEPDLIEDEGNTLADMVFDRFGDDLAPTVLAMRQALIDEAGAYLLDLHAHNVKFAPDLPQ